MLAIIHHEIDFEASNVSPLIPHHSHLFRVTVAMETFQRKHRSSGFIQVTTTEYVDPGEDQFSVVISCREGRNLWIQLSSSR